MRARISGASKAPKIAVPRESIRKKVVAVPMTRFTRARFPAPMAWATRMFAAMPTPNTTPSMSIMTILALPSAVIATSPRVWLTQI